MQRVISDWLLLGAERQPDALAYRYLLDGDDETVEISYAELLRRSAGLARLLARHGRPGSRVVLLFSAGLDSVIALYACFLARMVAVPTPAPHLMRIEAQSKRLVGVVEDCDPAFVLTTSDLLAAHQSFAAVSWRLALPRWIAVDDCDLTADTPLGRPDLDDLAILQYTSGTTSSPRGVMLPHGAIMANQLVIGEVTGPTNQQHFLSWLPFYHDMGLSFYLQPVFRGDSCTLMSPAHFLQRPLRWLKAISRHGATGTAVPNFALDRVADQLAGASAPSFDLSSMRMVVVGAEPVRARTLDRFCAATAGMGFRREALFPCYGMAETTVMFSTGPVGAPTVHHYDLATLTPDKDVRAARPDERGATSLVGNGCPARGHQAIVVSSAGLVVEEGHVGEIWLKGPSLGLGYWNRPEASAASFGASTVDGRAEDCLRTGDLGFLRDGELFICGRAKDMLIVLGRNLYVADIAEQVRQASAHVGEGVVAFEDETGAAIVILAEARHRHLDDGGAARDAIREQVARSFEVGVSDVVLLTPLGLPRTSSGKIQREQARQSWLAGTLPALGARKRKQVSETLEVADGQ